MQELTRLIDQLENVVNEMDENKTDENTVDNTNEINVTSNVTE